jgi:hypothetical protein
MMSMDTLQQYLETYKDQTSGVMNEGVIVHDGDLITFTTADILGTAQKCS